MFTRQSLRRMWLHRMWLHCIGCWRYRTTKMTLIALLLLSLLMFQLIADFTMYSNLTSLSSVIGYQNVYMKPVCRARTRFVYIKMMKCASTILSNAFRRFGMQRNLSFVLPRKGHMYVGWPYQIDDSLYRPAKSSAGFDILCDHAVYNRHKFADIMGQGTVYITSVREPFSQLKSMMNYYDVLNISGVPLSVSNRFAEFMTNIEQYEATYKSTAAAATRYCVPDGFSMTRSLMSFNLGFPTGGFRSVDDDLANDSILVRQWIAELDSEFIMVIITEYLDESMVLLRRLMCWRLKDILFEAQKPASYSYRDKEEADLVKLYHHWSPVDYQLYQHFNDTLWRKLAAQDRSFWDEVSHFRSVNKQVNQFCAHESKATLVIDESVWNPEFSVTMEFCRVLVGDLVLALRSLKQLQALYDRQPPTNLEERQQTRRTC